MIPKPHTMPEAPRKRDIYGNPIKKFNAVIKCVDGSTIRIENMYFSQTDWSVVFRNEETTRVVSKKIITDMELTEVSE